jgi:peptide/nickel transport system ATP-binding protein
MNESQALLEVQALEVRYAGAGAPSVQDVGFTLGRGERLGIVGESGSGKSTVCRALMGLLDTRTTVRAQALRFAGHDLLGATAATARREMAMVLQDPRVALNPVLRVGEQVAEMLGTRRPAEAGNGLLAALQMFERVRIRDPQRVLRAYPHQLSGGMAQRVMLAMMLVTRPALLLADEPTSALDTSVAAGVLDLMDELVEESGSAVVLVTHDLRLARRFCDRLIVMRHARVVETLAAADVDRAAHEYTRALFSASHSLALYP